jgi:two-component system, NarL family, nitrate/nitrite response regulator NarL
MSLIQVSIVDDHALFRRGVADIIRHSDKFNLMNEYHSGENFINVYEDACPDILLLDIHMPEMSGIEVLKVLNTRHHNIRIVMLTACEEEEVLLEALSLGAHGFLAKDTLPHEILENLMQVNSGKTVLQEWSINVLANQFRGMSSRAISSKNKGDRNFLDNITQREQETLKLIAEGLNNKLIARKLGISDGTVKVYVKNLLRKLSLHSRLELSVWAHKNLNLSDLNT